MKKILGLVFAAVLALAAAPAEAQSAKNAAQVLDLTALSTSGSFSTGEIFRTTLHTSQQKDVVVGVSLETTIGTDTTVKSSKGSLSTAWAEGTIEVCVLVDGNPAAPCFQDPQTGEYHGVVFDRRKQSMAAQFGGILQYCTDANLDGTIHTDECVWTDEMLQLVLDTTGAHSFNFVRQNLGSGTHDISVIATIKTDGSTTGSRAWAFIGNGSVTVEEVRFAGTNGMQL